MTRSELQDAVTSMSGEAAVPGVAVGVFNAGSPEYAFHGVTSLDNPLPVDDGTLFQFGSTGKTFTATALMKLVGDGRIDLDDRVRTYLPELTLKDPGVADEIRIVQLLNHTAGWDGDFEKDTGDGDDALARYVAAMANLDQLTPPGAQMSYNNAALCLAGRIIERITGQVFERFLTETLLAPIGLRDTWWFPGDIMTRRFAVGHRQLADGTVAVARPWALPRSGNPAGGMSATAADQIAWAQFHLNDGAAADGNRVVPAELIRQMRIPTVQTPGTALADAIGLTWLLRDIDGVRTVSHGGTTIGQHSAFLMVPERQFAVAVLTNSGPNGGDLHERIVGWALEHYLGLTESQPRTEPKDPTELSSYLGRYGTRAVSLDVQADDAGGLSAKPSINAEELAELGESLDADEPPVTLRFVTGERDVFVIADGHGSGMKGHFVRNGQQVSGIHFGGRFASRIDSGTGRG